MAGATAATAAGVTAPQASAITIDLLNNYFSVFGGNHLNADLTGDGHPDVTLAGFTSFFKTITTGGGGFSAFFWSFGLDINGVRARGYDNGTFPFRYVILGSQFASGFGGDVPVLTGKIPISFTDLDINGGRLTRGFLDVTASPDSVHLDSFSFNIPENGSSLALLAMGAGGVLALRRWRAARERA